MARSILATLAFALPLAAAAQVPMTPLPPASTSGLIVEPGEVRRCLCLERDIASSNQEVGARGRMYEDDLRELQQVDADLDRRRQTMNTENPSEVDTFRQLFDRRQALYS